MTPDSATSPMHVVGVNHVHDHGDGQLVNIELTLADGSRCTMRFAYPKIAVAVRELLAGHLAAALAREAAGTLDVKEHAGSFTLRKATLEVLAPSNAVLALFLEGNGVLPVQFDSNMARALARELLAVADEIDGPAGLIH